MEAEKVIKLRETLRAGKNLPLKISIDNVLRVIDETKAFQTVFWDDDNCILYVYALPDPNILSLPSNKEGTVSLFAVSYDTIQAMEVTSLPLANLGDTLDSLKASGISTITDEVKERIINVFTKILDPNIVALGPTKINEILEANAVIDNDDYYAGKFTESFKETKSVAEHNAYVDSLKEDKN
jgi:hypothetical protein